MSKGIAGGRPTAYLPLFGKFLIDEQGGAPCTVDTTFFQRPIFKSSQASEAARSHTREMQKSWCESGPAVRCRS